MKQNCRNCAWAEWSKTASGRRMFSAYAECAYPVVAVVPLSRPSVLSNLRRDAVSVAEYRDKDIECAAWVKVKK